MPFLIAASAFLSRIPREVWIVTAALLALWTWGNHREASGRRDGSTVQKQADTTAVKSASDAATALQSSKIAGRKADDKAISKRTDDALQKRYDDLAGKYDTLRLRWAAHRADQGGAGKGAADATTSAAIVANDAYCAASGWVSLNVASAAAEAADAAIAKDDAWRAWWTAQEAAWPK